MSTIPPPAMDEANISSDSENRGPHKIVLDYILKREPAFQRLAELRDKGWADPRGDEHFKQQRDRADKTDDKGAQIFYKMMRQIGDELEGHTHALSQASEGTQGVKILDLCMAPGGYSASALKYNPGAKAFGITLPPTQGGHKVLLKPSIVLYMDITMLANEFGLENPPSAHPEHKNFLNERPYSEHKFNLIFCDGQVLRTHQRAEHREKHEARRLTMSQLILALQRIRPGGTMIVLLHKLEAWDTVELLYHFNKFSSIQLFKPNQKHALRSSFYLVAKNVQSDADCAKVALDSWKRSWWNATFGGEHGTGGPEVKASTDYVQTVLDEFGSQLIELGRPVWQIQANALNRKLMNKWH